MGDVLLRASEKVFQENFVREMEKYKWEAPAYLDGNRQFSLLNPLPLKASLPHNYYEFGSPYP